MRFTLALLFGAPLFFACGSDTFVADDAAAPVDAPFDSPSTQDAQPPGPDASSSDGATSEGGVVDGSTPFSCTSPPMGTLVCTTFDGVTPAAGFTAPLVYGGALAFDTSTFTSPSRSLSATTTELADGGADATAFAMLLYQDLADTHATWSARANVRVKSIDPAGVVLLDLSYADGNAQVFAAVAALPTGFFLLVNDPAQSAPMATFMSAATLDTWYALRVDFTFATSQVSAYVDGAKVASSTKTLPAPTSKERDFRVGAVVSARSGPSAINVDDVLLLGL